MNKRVLSLLTAGMMALTSCAAQAEGIKHQRVYAVISEDGQVQSLVDHVHLENRDRADILEDLSELSNIENVRGDETFTRDGSGLIWQADGKDIVYQGEGVRRPDVIPVLSFHSGGQEVSREEAQKAEGPVTIRVSYEMAGDSSMLFINLIVLPEDAEIVKAEHATTLVMGSLNLLLGWAVPGLESAMGLPETFEVTADLHGQMPEWVLVLGTSGVLSDSLRQIGGVYEAAKTVDADLQRVLTAWEKGEETPEVENKKLKAVLEEIFPEHPVLDAARETQTPETTEGTTGVTETPLHTPKEQSGMLAACLKTISEGIGALESSQGKLVTGTAQITAGTGTLSEHAGAWGQKAADVHSSTQNLNAGAEKMEKSVKTLSTQSGTLSSTAASVSETGKSVVSGIEQLQKTADEIKSGAESLNKSVISLNSGIGTVNKGASDTKTASGSLHSGMSTLQADLQSLTGQNAALSGEADQLMTVTLASGRVVLDMALRNLNVDVPELTYENYTRVLSDLEALLNKELLEAYTVSQKRESLKVSYEEEIKEIRKNTEEAVRMRILNEVLALEGMSFGADQYEKRIKAGQITRRTQQRIRSTVAQRMADEEIVAAIEEQVDAQVEQIVDELMASDNTTEKIRTELETTDLEEIRELIRAVRSQLDQTAALKTDMETYFGTVNAAAEKAKTLKTASSALSTAAGTLSEQAAALATAASAPGSAAVTLQSSGAALSKSAQALARQAKTEQTSLGEMAKAAECLDTGVTALKTDASALHTAVGTLLSATEALKTLKTSLDADVKTIADASASLTTQAGTLASLLTSQKDAAAEAAEMVSAMPVDPASIEPVAETLIPERSQDESTTAASGSPAGEEAKKAASVLLGHAQSDLMQLLNLYTGIRDTLGGGSDYDPVPEGMTGDTVYIYRMMIQ